MTGTEPQASAAEWLESLAEVGWRPGLERSTELMRILGSPQNRYRTIHVVGTNGKTSTTLYAAALLEASGRRSGSLTSPHLTEWTERVRVGGEPIDDTAWLGALDRVRAAVGGMEAADPSLGRVSQFEAATAAGFLALAEAGVEFGVIEAGLGGRLDSTNLIESEVTVLTSVGLDHTEWLGETEPEIAGEKLAVLRPRTALVTGPLGPEVRELAAREAEGKDSSLVTVDDPGRDPARPTGRYARIDFALALAAVELLIGATDEPSRQRALAKSGLRGRLELVRAEPPVILDVAHNRDGVAALAASVTELTEERPLVLVFGCLDDRDPAELLGPLVPLAVKVFACRAPALSGPRGRTGLDPVLIGRAAGRLGIEFEVVEDPVDAVETAVTEAARAGGAVLVCGSHGLIRRAIPLQP